MNWYNNYFIAATEHTENTMIIKAAIIMKDTEVMEVVEGTINEKAATIMKVIIIDVVEVSIKVTP